MLRGTIASNVRLGHPDATDDQVRDALDRAGGEALEASRPIADDGEGLSAGERRRVALARALLRIELGGAAAGAGRTDRRPGPGHRGDRVAAVRGAGVGAVVVSHRPALRLADEMVSPYRPADRSRRCTSDLTRHVIALVRRLLRQADHGWRQLVVAIALATFASGASVALMGTSAWLLSRAAEHPRCSTCWPPRRWCGSSVSDAGSAATWNGWSVTTWRCGCRVRCG